ncbi:hypothetical protein G3O00_42805 [Burkholderia sp. Ac-20384]|nr:hypothetical protein [Burkholderia sp. Ac-20384]
MVPIASGSQHRQPGFGTHSFMPGAASAAPFSSYGEPSGSSAQPQNFAIASSSRHVAQEPAPGSASQVASSSRNTLPPAGSSAVQYEATHASEAIDTGKMNSQVKNALNKFFDKIDMEMFEALTVEKRAEIVDNFTPDQKLRSATLQNLRSDIRTALRKLDLLPLGTPRSDAERPADELAALAKITAYYKKSYLRGFMNDLRKYGSSITLFEQMTAEQRQVHIDRYLLRKSDETKAALKNALKTLGLSGTGQ